MNPHTDLHPDKSAAVDHYTRLAAQALADQVDPLGATLGRFVPMPPPAALCTWRPQVGPDNGRRHGRVYRSLGDVLAYEAGYLAHVPGRASGAVAGTPFDAGWTDAAADAATDAATDAAAAARDDDDDQGGLCVEAA